MLYMIARGLLRVYFSLFRGWVINGIENVPAKGSLIVVANHSSYWDPPIVGSVLPRRVYFMAKEELFRYPLFGNLLSLLGAFPVKRGAPDRTAIRRALTILQDGLVLGMFPEGTRSKSGKLGEAQPGVALLALKSGSPILPIGISGAHDRSKLVIKIGEPFLLSVDSRQKESLRIAGKEIMQRIDNLLIKGN